jgi:sugar/nucleoside kinase (ribokinase family)
VRETDDVDVLFAGGVFCDLVFGGVPHLPTPGSEVYADQFDVTAGGTATRAVAAARLGLRTGLFAVIGCDMFGDHVTAQLGAEDNLDLRWLRRVPGVCTPVTVAVTDEHDRAFLTYEDPAVRRPETWGDKLLPHATVLQLGIGAALPPWAAELRERGSLVVGGVGWDATGLWSSDLLRRLAEVDVFVLNAVEAVRYTRTDSVEKAVKLLADLVSLVVVTDGKDGAVAVDSGTGELLRVPAPCVPVADPTGAGDVFTASLITGLLRDWPLATRLRFAAICAALSVRTLGGASSAPTWATVLDFLARTPDVSADDRALIMAAAG